jgi:hypothetical protein
MRIVIETDEGEKPTPSVHAQPSAAAETAPAVPPEIAATAAALGAASAGPAPAEAAGDEPASFVPEPGTPETTLDGPEGMSAGAAPQFALGPVDEVAAEDGAGEGDAGD